MISKTLFTGEKSILLTLPFDRFKYMLGHRYVILIIIGSGFRIAAIVNTIVHKRKVCYIDSFNDISDIT